MHKQDIRFFTIPAMELAATASLPRWPIITVNIVKPQPHTSSFAITGVVYFTKSFLSTACDFFRRLQRIRTTPSLRFSHIARISSAALAVTVATAAPLIPSFGNPNSPKIKIPFKKIFKTMETEPNTVLLRVLPLFLMIHR